MPPVIRTVYSNAVDIQTSETELILNFGAEFAGSEGGKAQFIPEVRVVIPKGGAEQLISFIRQAVESDGSKAASKVGARPAASRRRAK